LKQFHAQCVIELLLILTKPIIITCSGNIIINDLYGVNSFTAANAPVAWITVFCHWKCFQLFRI